MPKEVNLFTKACADCFDVLRGLNKGIPSSTFALCKEPHRALLSLFMTHSGARSLVYRSAELPTRHVCAGISAAPSLNACFE